MEPHHLCHLKCELNSFKYPCCPGYYPEDLSKVEVVVVAEAPGKQEVVDGKPLTGSAGKVLWKALHEAGLCHLAGQEDKYVWAYGLLLKPLEGWAFDNVVHCNPPNNTPPSILDRLYCSKHLWSKLNQCVNLKLIVTLGDTALNFLTGESKVLKRRGMPFLHYFPSMERRVAVMPLLHPSFILRQRQWFDTFVKDVRKAGRLWREGLTEYRVEALDLDTDAVAELLKTGFAFDIETTGFDFTTERIIGCSFANSEGRAWHAWKDNGPQWELAKHLLESDCWKAAQNNCFDVPFLNYHGVGIEGVDYDTCYAQHLLHPDLPSNLGYIASLYTDSPYYKEQRDELLAGRLTHEQVKQYCCHDSSVTRAAVCEQLREFDPSLREVFNSIVMPSSRVANQLIRKGVRIDTQRVTETREALEKVLHPIRDTFLKFGCNLNAPQQLKQVFAQMGVTLEDTKADTLVKTYQRTSHPLLPTVMKYRKLNKVLSTFLLGLETKVDSDGFLHTTYRVDGTKNSRWSSRNPNLQNIPTDVRKLFIPSSPTKVFVQADYSRLELFVAGVVSGDTSFLFDVESTPIHDLMAEELFGAGYTKHQRLLAKTVIFGTIYGRSARSIAVAFGIPVVDATTIQHKVARKYERLTRWAKESYDTLTRQGFLRSAFGRIRYFEDGNTLSQASNYPVQTAAGDITNTSLILLATKEDIRLTVHDSIVCECEATRVDDCVKNIKDVMSRPIPQLQGYQFPITVEVGTNWGEMEVVKEEVTQSRADIDELDEYLKDEEEEVSYA